MSNMLVASFQGCLGQLTYGVGREGGLVQALCDCLRNVLYSCCLFNLIVFIGVMAVQPNLPCKDIWMLGHPLQQLQAFSQQHSDTWPLIQVEWQSLIPLWTRSWYSATWPFGRMTTPDPQSSYTWSCEQSCNSGPKVVTTDPSDSFEQWGTLYRQNVL